MASILQINSRKLALTTSKPSFLQSPFRLVCRDSAVRTTRRLFTTNKTPSGSNQAKEAISEEAQKSAISRAWQKFIGPKPMPERWTLPWYREVALICTVFAITGSSTMVVVRPAVSNGLGLKGSLKDGPWSYRICSLVIMTPVYASLLVLVGTVFGRHHYFRHFSVKMWSRFGIPPEMIDESFHETKKHFRKW
eukprot:scaffold5048_cov121-Cylindrotheca_fusiformis.AAC.7